MLSSTFNSYFSNNLIKNCNVKIYKNDTTPTLLLDKENISSFSLSRSNYGVLENVPSDRATIDILAWDSLSDDIKTYLGTESNVIKITFTVEESETTDCLVAVVSKLEVDYLRKNAKLILLSPFQSRFARGSIYEVDYHNCLAMPSSTEAEIIQHEALREGKGAKVKSASKTSVFNFYSSRTRANEYAGSITQFDLNDRTSSFLSYSPINIYKGSLKKYNDSQDRSQIRFFGIKEGDEQVIGTSVQTQSSTGMVMATFYYGNETFVPTRFTVSKEGSSMDYTGAFAFYEKNNLYCSVWSRGSSILAGTYTITVYGYRPSVSINGDYKYTGKICTLSNSDPKVSSMQTIAREYYSHTTYYEFDCRINPCIEPQDSIYVESLGILVVEEVKVDFNGGFSGHIKARYWVEKPKLIAPVLSNLVLPDDPSDVTYSFQLTNQNNVQVLLNINCSAGLLDYYAIGAGQTITINETDYDGKLDISFAEYVFGSLQDSVYAYFTADNYDDSDNTIILQGDHE